MPVTGSGSGRVQVQVMFMFGFRSGGHHASNRFGRLQQQLQRQVVVSREQSFYLVVFGSQAYRRDGCRVRRHIGTRLVGFAGHIGARSCRVAVRCQRRVEVRRQIGAVLVVPVQNPDVLVYPQPAAPVLTLNRRKKACSVTNSP